MKPKSILDPSFRYTPSFATDVKGTFARLRRQQRQAAAGRNEARAAAVKHNIVLIERGKAPRSI